MKMIFRELYLFSPVEKKARKISFEDGLNIITSSQADGNTRGKTVIMRSLFHALGAEGLFDSKWDTKDKVYILKFSIDDYIYYIYRSGSIFKIFDDKKQLISVSTRSTELADNLKDLTDFAVMLPDRFQEKLEITPPVYNYLPYFLDQDHHEGSKFSSFDKLGQYKDYKQNVLYYHFGVYDETYFSLVQEREMIDDQIRGYEKRKEVVLAMIEDVDTKIGNRSYETDISSLRRDVDRYKREYAMTLSKLDKSKKTIINLRNNLLELEQELSETEASEKKTGQEIKILKKNKCPECGSVLENTLFAKSRKYNLSEDYVIVKNDIQISIHETKKRITEQEEKYSGYLRELEEFENKLKINDDQIDDVLRYKGFCEIRSNLVEEESELNHFLSLASDKRKELNKSLKQYASKKEAVLGKYMYYLGKAKIDFNLAEIDEERFKSLATNFKASGADKDIVTLIWYFTIIRLRNEFNPEAIKYPLVLDSPCNTEMDDKNREETIKYIFENTDLSSQVIVSGIGLDKDLPPDLHATITKIDNEKYSLLSGGDYELYSSLLIDLCDAE